MEQYGYHLAQVNIGRILAPMSEPLMQDFANGLEEINALADNAPGFVWRLQTEAGDATSILAFDDTSLLINMSVWEDVESLRVALCVYFSTEFCSGSDGRPLKEKRMLPTLEIYSSLDCPYAYLAVYRLRQVWPEFAGRVRLVWRALSLEYVNSSLVSRPLIDAERELFALIEPALPFHPWPRPAWDWPVTMWPAFEAVACAQAQNDEAGFAMSWALRHAFFAQGRNIALRHELFAIAREVAAKTALDIAEFEADWDDGRYKSTIIVESGKGWHELKVNGSATFVWADGRQLTNPAIGEIDFDETQYITRSYAPYVGDPLQVYRELLAGG
jgi:hypothetical protein